MSQKTVWLNTHFNTIQVIRAADTNREFRIIGSYSSRKYPEAVNADLFEIEPKLSPEEYVDWALGFVRKHKVDVFMPCRKMAEIAARIQEFEALGCTVILASDAETLNMLDNKARFYETLGPDLVPLPDYAVANSIDEFAAALDAIQQRHSIVCFKPTVGIFGYGFRIIRTPENAEALAGVDHTLIVDRQGAIEYVTREPFKQQMLMQFLDGEECSVDCLAQEGKLLRTIVRGKLPDGSRYLAKNPTKEEFTRRIIGRIPLNGAFNVQFKDHGGVPYILEINPRMSGGTPMSCLSGVALPYWAIKLALGGVGDKDIPQPRLGLRVAEFKQASILGPYPD